MSADGARVGMDRYRLRADVNFCNFTATVRSTQCTATAGRGLGPRAPGLPSGPPGLPLAPVPGLPQDACQAPAFPQNHAGAQGFPGLSSPENYGGRKSMSLCCSGPSSGMVQRKVVLSAYLFKERKMRRELPELHPSFKIQ